MLILSALITLVIAIPVLTGFIHSRERHSIDRRHFAAFVGFSAAIVALGATIAGITSTIIWFKPPQHPYYHPFEQGFVAIFSIIGLLSTGTAFFAGFFSDGIRRVALVLFGPAMAVVYVLAAFSNFGP